MKTETFDLLSTVEYGGCSAKLPPQSLVEILQEIPLIKNNRIMVDISSHDDAGVYLLNEQTALIVTTDFFPPICSDPFTFGEIAATNALSDVYAMGGDPLLTLNLNLFPEDKIPIDVLGDILKGGQKKVNESGAFTMGGHTINDYPPKYGLSVVGVVDPKRLISNKGAQVGQLLILTKPIGCGVLSAGHRLSLTKDESYAEMLNQMSLLNKVGKDIMQKYQVTGATDITGFGLAGHAYQMALASEVSFQIETAEIPVLPQTYELLSNGCIPGAIFRNRKYVQEHVRYSNELSPEQKLITTDAQTSGGLLIAVDKDKANDMLSDFKESGVHPYATIIGEVIRKRNYSIYFN